MSPSLPRTVPTACPSTRNSPATAENWRERSCPAESASIGRFQPRPSSPVVVGKTSPASSSFSHRSGNWSLDTRTAPFSGGLSAPLGRQWCAVSAASGRCAVFVPPAQKTPARSRHTPIPLGWSNDAAVRGCRRMSPAWECRRWAFLPWLYWPCSAASGCVWVPSERKPSLRRTSRPLSSRFRAVSTVSVASSAPLVYQTGDPLFTRLGTGENPGAQLRRSGEAHRPALVNAMPPGATNSARCS